jgi:hypothetical protein
MWVRLAFAASGVAAILGTVACSSKDTHPPLAGACEGAGCPPPAPVLGGGLHHVDAGPDTLPGPLPEGGTGTLTGNVGVYADEQFVRTTAYQGQGTVGVSGDTGARVTAAFQGSTYVVTGITPSSTLWVDLTDGSRSGVLNTITAVPGGDTNAPLAFVDQAIFSNIGASLVAHASLDPGLGHVVLRFVDGSNVPVSGIQITGQPNAVIAYDAGSLYSDSFGQTQDRGVAIVFNASAGPAPAGALSIIAFKNATTSKSGSLNVHIAQNTVTFVTVLVN